MFGYTIIAEKTLKGLEEDYQSETGRLRVANRELQVRLNLALLSIMFGGANLQQIFGKLDYQGTNEACTAQLWRAQNGLVNLAVQPGGSIVLTDPEGRVDGIKITPSPEGVINGKALDEINHFLASVLLTRHTKGRVVTEVVLTVQPDDDIASPVFPLPVKTTDEHTTGPVDLRKSDTGTA